MRREEEKVWRCWSMSPMRRMERKGSTPTRSTTCRVKCQVLSVFLLRKVLWRFMRRPGTHTLTAVPCLQNTYMKDKFMIKIETWHKPDMGDQDNVHGIDKRSWEATEIVDIDIADRSCISQKDYKPELDPAIFKSQKTGRGPLGPGWKKELANNPNCPHMCAYKLVTLEFKWMGLQSKMENYIHKMEKRIFTHFHRELFCWIDKWVDLSMDDIRRMEEETKKELDEMRKNDDVKGMSADDN
uniref:Phosphatidylinositol transfer protein alpha isoform n=1 Tax=Monopterus albus TaxID=43700 RepID=A0A3Q3KPW9_MONAL